MRRDRSGFKYALTKNGIDFYKRLNSEYAEEYRALARKTIEALRNTDDVKLISVDYPRVNESIEEVALL